MNLDGEPIWSPIKDNDLKFAVNTNWDLFEHEPTKTFYLRSDESWLKATDVEGPVDARRQAAGELHASCPADDNWKDVKAALPGKKPAPTSAAAGVFVSTTPAEMILLRGAPSYLPVQGTQAAVGEQHRQRRVPAGQDRPGLLPRRRTLVLGARLHRAVDVRHADAARGLQEDPARAPALARARVGAGHAQAAEAVLLAQVPQTARVEQEDGEGARGRRTRASPKFEPIEKTTVARAVNTDKDIIKVGDLYYMCFQGVWFMAQSAERPVGGHRHRSRRRSTRFPSARPSHNVTYVTVAKTTTTTGSRSRRPRRTPA